MSGDRSRESKGATRRSAVKTALGAIGVAVIPKSMLAQTHPSYYPSAPPITSFSPSTTYTVPATAAPPPLRVPPRTEPALIEPVRFWSDTALQLDALDHSIDAADARAPGPCAASRALALAHIVIADACAAAYDCGYSGLIVRGGRAPTNEFAEAFVGGAAARILGH